MRLGSGPGSRASTGNGAPCHMSLTPMPRRSSSSCATLMSETIVGTFVLAESALLDGEEATTTWWLSPLFRQRYPRVRLDESRIIVQSNTVLTAGAALSHMDLALAIIRRASPELANLTARYLVVDVRTSQSIYSIPDHLANSDPLIRRFERWARGRLAEGFSLDQAAQALGTSKRTLARRMEACWASRRSPSSRICGLNARCTSSGPAKPASADRRRSRLCRGRDSASAAAPEARPRRARNPPESVRCSRLESGLALTDTPFFACAGSHGIECESRAP